MTDCGINIRDETGWRLCSREEGKALVRSVPGFLDFRR
jgi:hypothetical protein